MVHQGRGSLLVPLPGQFLPQFQQASKLQVGKARQRHQLRESFIDVVGGPPQLLVDLFLNVRRNREVLNELGKLCRKPVGQVRSLQAARKDGHNILFNRLLVRFAGRLEFLARNLQRGIFHVLSGDLTGS